jgi:SAM-dependent methyltransferase
MVELVSMPPLSLGELRGEIQKEYRTVARDPYQGFHFHTGREALQRLDYQPTLYDGVPEENVASFAGMGNPFLAGPIQEGETVLDVGSGAGLDALIAARLVGPEGCVVGVDMTPEMLDKARSGAKEMCVANVAFREGLAEELPLPDAFADVLISNGVLNLTVDKPATLREWMRVLKPGGRLQIGDIVLARQVPESAMSDISLWTG